MTKANLPPYVVLEKEVGQTPLQAIQKWQREYPQYADIPAAYAGRLDPMASGKLLILLGDECKNQTAYHALDKRYAFSVLLGISSDSGDVLGILGDESRAAQVSSACLRRAATTLSGTVTLPYPHFSSKTVAGKPLFQWALENRLHEIEIPTKESRVYRLKFEKLETKPFSDIYTEALQKINTLPEVTEASKQLGADFRREDVRHAWQASLATHGGQTFSIAHFSCIASSGTYMRTLAEEIAKACDTRGLAFHIHRTHVGRYQALPFGLGFWKKQF